MAPESLRSNAEYLPVHRVDPSSCPVCAPHVRALQRFLDTPLHRWTTEEVFEAVRAAVHDIRHAQCGVRPERLLLPVMLRLLMRDDLDAVTQRNVRLWVQMLEGSLTPV
jgi:hypothetical protein